MDMMKMLGQLQASQQKVEEEKLKLAGEFITEKSSDNLLEVTVSKAGTIKDIKADESLLEDKEQLEDYLVMTLNKALTRARDEFDAKLEQVAKSGMPNIPGMPF